MRLHVKRSSFLLLILLQGCALLGLPTPSTFNERLAAGYSTVTAIRQETLSLLNAKRISADDAQNVQSQADNARAALDVVGLSFLKDPVMADTKLTATITILTALQAYLATRRSTQ